MTFTRPNHLDPLALSNTKSQVEILDEVQDAVETLQAGGGSGGAQPYLNPASQAAVTVSTLINDATAGSINPGTWFTRGNINAGGFVTSFGRNSWQNGVLKLGVQEAADPSSWSYSGINFTTAIPVAGNGVVGVWLAWDYFATSSFRNGSLPINALFEIVVSDGPTFTGNVVTATPIYGLSSKQVFSENFVQLYGLTTVKCIGVRQIMAEDLPDNAFESRKILQSTMSFATASELEVAMANPTTRAVVVAPNFVPTVTPHFDVPPPAGITKLDLRPSKKSLSGFEGIKRFSDYEGTVDDGSVPMNFHLIHAINQLKDGDTLQFNRNGKYDCAGGGITIYNKKNITLDLNGATFYTTGMVGGFWGMVGCRNVRIMSSGRKARIVMKHLNIGTGANAGNVLVPGGGAVTSGATTVLANWGDAATTVDPYWFTENEDGYIEVDFLLSQTGTAAQDCYIEFIPENSPPRPGVVASASAGGLIGGGAVYFYRMSWVDAEGTESGMGDWGSNVISSAWGQMTLTLPVPVRPTTGIPIVAKRIYRGQTPSQSGAMSAIITLPAAWTTWTDNGPTQGGSPPNPLAVPSVADAGAGNIAPGTYAWYVTQIDATGRETQLPALQSPATGSGCIIGTTTGQMTITLPSWTGVSRMRVYRGPGSGLNGLQSVFFVGEPTAGAATFVDNVASPNQHVEPPRWRQPDGAGLAATAPDAISPETRLTLTSTPTTYKVKLRHTQHSRDDLMRWRITKFTNQVNTITVHSFTNYTALKIAGNSQGYFGVDPDGGPPGVFNRRDNSHAFSFMGGCRDVSVENVKIYKPLGDGFYCQNSNSGYNNRGITLKDVEVYAQGRQGIALMSGEYFRFENCKFRGGGGQTIDIEWEHGDRGHIEMINFESFNPESTHVACNDTTRNVVMRGCKFINTYGNQGADFHWDNLIYADIRNCDFKSLNVALTGGQFYIDQITAGTLVVGPAGPHANAENIGGEYWTGDGATINNVRLTPTLSTGVPFVCNMTTSFVSNIVTTYPFDAFTPGLPNSGFFGGPFQMTQSKTTRLDNTLAPNLKQILIHEGHASAANLDPGPWKLRYPDTWKGTIVGTDPHFPTGLNMLDEPVLNVRGISSTTVRPNNLRVGPIAVTAGATSLTVPFPAQTYADLTFCAATAITGIAGSNMAGTYFYRVAARTASGGPRPSISNEASVIVGGAFNAVSLNVGSFLGATAYIEGLTVYRGTATGVYNTRFDLFPTRAVFTLSADVNGRHVFKDTGSTFYVDSGRAIGYPIDPLPATPTASYAGTTAWDGAKWIHTINQTGWEPDQAYDVLVETSWATTVGVTAHLPSGPTLVFGTAAPSGATVTLKIGR